MKKFLLVGLVCLMLVFTVQQVSQAAPSFKVKLIYTVQEGDALVKLAHRFDVTVDKIKEVNDLGPEEFIRYGDELVIPQGHSVSTKKVSTDQQLFFSFYQPQGDLEKYELNCNGQYEVKIEKKPSSEVDVSQLRTLSYHVKSGDNLYELANEFNTSVATLKKLNGLESNVIQKGDKIELPINNLSQKEVLYHTINDQEIDLLARLIHGEARGESYIGQVAVGAVILNRVISSYFPDTIKKVIYQPNQFTPVANGQIKLSADETAYQAAKAVLQGKDPTRGAQYFYNPQTARDMWWFKTREVIVEIGNHVFAK
ncbi:cell wall hydrolase [Halanaerobaculum tunisiense]